MPLQIGTSGLTALERAALYLVPSFVCGVIAAGPLLAVFAAIGDVGDTLGKILFMILILPVIPFYYAVRRGWRALMHALEERPSDIVIDGDALVILGGPHHGKRVALAKAGCKLTENTIDDGDTPASQLVLAGEQVAVAVRPAERKSLAAVHDTIAALCGPHKKPAAAHALEILTCPHCNAPAIPVDAPTVVCASCGQEIPVPDEIRERARAVAEMAKDAPRNERRLRSLLRQPSARAANATMGILGIPMMLVWPLIGFVAYVLFDEDKLTFGGFGTLVVGALAMVTALYFLARVWLVNRQGLAIVTTHFGAAPPAAPGQPSTCRVCNAVLPSAAGSLFAQCAYCGADNVLGLDVRGDAKLERAQSASLTTALARRTADRVTFGVLAIAAAAVMVGDVKLLKPHLVPVGTWMRCNGDHPACGTPLEAFEKRCATGDAAACAKVLDLAPKVYTLYDFGPNDSTLALQAGCTKGAAIACRGAGDHDWEDKTSHDAPRAKAALSRGCELGDGSACTELGEIDERRRDTTYEQIESGDYSTLPARSAAAYALFDKGCKAGDPAACLDAGTYLRGGVAGVPADLSRAKALAAAACKATGPKSPACSRVACDGGDMKACLELATAYAQGSGVQADDELVMSLDEQACEGSNGEACALSGYQRAHSKAYKPDLPRAHELYKKGCELGSGLGCHNLGHAYFVGDGVDKDLTEALTWFTRACKLGYENGCGAVDEVKAALAKQGSGIGDQGSGLNPGP